MTGIWPTRTIVGHPGVPYGGVGLSYEEVWAILGAISPHIATEDLMKHEGRAELGNGKYLRALILIGRDRFCSKQGLLLSISEQMKRGSHSNLILEILSYGDVPDHLELRKYSPFEADELLGLLVDAIKEVELLKWHLGEVRD